MEEIDDLAVPEAVGDAEPWTIREPAEGPPPLSTVGELPPLPQWR